MVALLSAAVWLSLMVLSALVGFSELRLACLAWFPFGVFSLGLLGALRKLSGVSGSGS